MPESLTVRVAVAMSGRDVTIDDLLLEFPDATYVQMKNCLDGLVNRKWAKRAQSYGGGKKTVFRGLYEVPTLKVRVSCVWDLGIGRLVNIPKAEGQRFQPLGEW